MAKSKESKEANLVLGNLTPEASQDILQLIILLVSNGIPAIVDVIGKLKDSGGPDFTPTEILAFMVEGPTPNP